MDPHTALEPLEAGSLDALMAAWLAQVSERTGSTRTPVEYRKHVTRFLALVGNRPEAATPAHAHAFAYGPGVSGREPSPSTVNVRLAAVRSFYDFARRMGRVSIDPTADVRRPHLEPPTPHGLTTPELKRLLAAFRSDAVGTRDRAITLTMVLTGLRRAEALSLTRADLTRNGSVYYTARTKGGRQRHRELPGPAFDAILAALAAEGRDLETMPEGERLFSVSPSGYALNLRRAAKRAKLANVTPHTLRHSAAKLRRETGASLEDVQQLLGHASLATTARYLARLEGEADAGWIAAANALGL